MRIALYSFPNLAHGGGYENYIMSLANELVNCGHDVSVVTINRKLQFYLAVLLRIFYFKPRLPLKHSFRLSPDEIKETLGGASLHEVSSVKSLKRVLREVDVIYSKNEFLDLFVLKMLEWGDLPPIICGVHTPIFYPIVRSFYSKLHNSLYLGKIYRFLLDMCSGIHVMNPDDKRILEKSFPDIGAKLFQIPYFLDVNNSAKIEKNSPKFRILFAGRLTEQKGLDTLEKVIEILSDKPQFEDMTFTIAGSGDLDVLAEILTKEYANVSFLGHLNRDRMSALYQSHDISIVPSRWETVSYVCLESQSYGLPVVASNISGPSYVVINKETGFLVDPESPDDFASAVMRLYHLKEEQPIKFRSMCKKARLNINTRFSTAKVVPELEKMFKEVVERGC